MAKKDTDGTPSQGTPKQRRNILKLLPRIFLGLFFVVFGILFLTNSDALSQFFMYVAVYVFGVFYFLPGVCLIVLGLYLLFRTFKPREEKRDKKAKKGLLLDWISLLLFVYCVLVLFSSGLNETILGTDGVTYSLTVPELNSYYGQLMKQIAPSGLHVALYNRISWTGGGYLACLAVACGNSIGLGSLGTIIIFAVLMALFALVLLRHPFMALARSLAYSKAQLSSVKALAPNNTETSIFRNRKKATKEDDASKASAPTPKTEQKKPEEDRRYNAFVSTTSMQRFNTVPLQRRPEETSAGEKVLKEQTQEAVELEQAESKKEVSSADETKETSTVFNRFSQKEDSAKEDSNSFFSDYSSIFNGPIDVTPKPQIAEEPKPGVEQEKTAEVVKEATAEQVETSSAMEEPKPEPVASEPVKEEEPAKEPDPVIIPEPIKVEVTPPVVEESPVSNHVEPEEKQAEEPEERPVEHIQEPKPMYVPPVTEKAKPTSFDATPSYRAENISTPEDDSANDKAGEAEEHEEDESAYSNKLNQTDEEVAAEKKAYEEALDKALNAANNETHYHEFVVPEELRPKPLQEGATEVTQTAKTEVKPIEPEVKTVEEAPKKVLDYAKPGIDLLNEYDNSNAEAEINDEATKTGMIISRFLKEYEIPANMTGYTIGASITRFHLNWMPGAKSTTISPALITTLKIRLSGNQSVRFVPVIIGCDYSAIEVGNPKSLTVPYRDCFIELMKLDKNCEQPTLFPLGKDISGQVITAQLEKLPHLLVAGSTGSGKSVFVHSLIISLIMRNYPQNLKMVLIDPKKVEFAKYQDLPHLLCPIITETEEAIKVLSKLVEEMEKRYELFQKAHVSDLKSYNKKQRPANRLPLIVVIIDEFAELVFTGGKEPLDYVSRLAAKARACGIHMVVATQRPSTNVITGDIKNNIPARIGLYVPTQVDSRVIIDENGAETLMGKGDLLARIPGVKQLIRCQSAYISDSEIDRIVDYLRQRADPEYAPEFLPKDEDDDPLEAVADDPYYEDVKEHIIKTGSISYRRLHRIFGVDDERIELYLEAMEKEGLIKQTVNGGYQVVVDYDPEEEGK